MTAWAFIQAAYVLGLGALIVATRALLDALATFHRAGLQRLHHDTRETSQ
jgi:hypothetical protein